MGGADNNKNVNNNRILEAFQRSGKRVREDENERRQRPRHQEESSGEQSDDITPRASINNLNVNDNNLNTDTSDAEVSSIDSQVSLPTPTIRINNKSRETSRETVVDTDTRNNAKLKLAFKIDNIRNKNERYDSHVAFLKRCVDSDIIPNGLKCYVEPSIGNRDEEFLNEWHAILNECSKKLMNLTIEYSEKTKENTTTQIKTLTDELKDMVSDSTYKNIASSLKKNEESRTKDLVQRKNRKFYRLKYGEKERETQAQPRVNNRENEIWNNRSQRGQGTRTSEDRQERERTQRRWNEDRRDDNNRSSRYANNNFSSERNEDRILDVIDRRNQRDGPIHERIVGRRRSRRNIHERNDPVEDFLPLRASPREDNP